jgi:hypothetical protein
VTCHVSLTKSLSLKQNLIHHFMRFIYPQSILNPRLPDEMFQDEITCVANAGHTITLIDSEFSGIFN